VIDSGLFVGTIALGRFTVVLHALIDPLLMVQLDADCAPELMRVSAVTSDTRWNPASFDDHDHLGALAAPRRARRSSRCGARRRAVS
jgi:DUF1365 family protein